MTRAVVFMDAHVHVYPGADAGALLDAAHRNFLASAAALDLPDWQGMLLLTETCRDDWFNTGVAPDGRVGPWQLHRLPGDDISLRAERDGKVLTLVAGRQIVTAERLEVHAIGTRTRIADGANLERTLAAVDQAGAAGVLPWGVGKWTGSRGRLLNALLADPARNALALSDNGGRPALWFDRRLAGRGGRPILRGTDPLPLPGEERRVGESGCCLAGVVDPDRPGTWIRERLRSLRAAEVRTYGPPERFLRFLYNQVALRLRNRPEE